MERFPFETVSDGNWVKENILRKALADCSAGAFWALNCGENEKGKDFHGKSTCIF